MSIKQRFASCYEMMRQSFLHLLYPSRCLHCQTLLPPQDAVFCLACASLLDLIPVQARCPTCFGRQEKEAPSFCEACLHHPTLYTGIASAFEDEGPPSSLVRCLKETNQPHLARGMAAFLVAQWDRLGWPIPDALVPVPLSWMHKWARGYNQSLLLAEEMGKMLRCPVWDALKRQSGDYRQSSLPFEQRLALTSHRFQLRLRYSLRGKTLLVIDDVTTSGATLRCCAEALKIGQPASLYALTFCRTPLDQEG